MRNRFYILFIIISLLIGCTQSIDKNSIIEHDLEICLGENNAVVFEELVESFEDFLVRNHYTTDYNNIPQGIEKYVNEVRLGLIPFESLHHDKKKNSELVKKLYDLGFINTQNNRSEYTDYCEILNIELLYYELNGSPFFNPYKTFLPCLKNVISDTTSFIYYYLGQKEKYGDINLVVMAHDLRSGISMDQFESKIMKEIIIIEFYIGLLLNNTEKSSAPNSTYTK